MVKRLGMAQQAFTKLSIKSICMTRQGEIFDAHVSSAQIHNFQKDKGENGESSHWSCPICLVSLLQDDLEIIELAPCVPETGSAVVKMASCGHYFHEDCILKCFRNGVGKCPSCNKIYGVFFGNQPDGTMTVEVRFFFGK